MKKRVKIWKRKVDNKMKYCGETDYDKKIIRVNPRKGELLNTIMHEEVHKKYPKKKEKAVKNKASKMEKKLTVGKAIKLLKKYKPGGSTRYFSA